MKRHDDDKILSSAADLTISNFINSGANANSDVEILAPQNDFEVVLSELTIVAEDEKPDKYMHIFNESIQQALTKVATDDSANTSAYTQYIRDMRKFPVFTPEEELETAKKAYEGDREAIDQLTLHNLRLPVYIAYFYRRCGVMLEDLIQEGNLGLMQASEKYNYQKGFRFSTYAVFQIRSCICKYLSNQGHAIRIPPSAYANVRRVRNAIDTYQKEHNGQLPSIVDLAEMLGKKTKLLNDAMQAVAEPIYIDSSEPIADQNGIEDNFRTAGIIEPDAVIEREELRDAIRNALKACSEIERHIIELNLGLIDGKSRTLDEIAEEFGRSKSTVFSLRENGLKKIADSTHGAVLKEFVS